MSSCNDCAYWRSSETGRGEYETGTCHFNPPIGSEDASALLPVQSENPAYKSLRMQLEKATCQLSELQKLNRYPGNIGKCFDEIKEIQLGIRAAEGQIAIIKEKMAIEEKFVFESRLIMYKKGLWPTTVATDICGRWVAQ